MTGVLASTSRSTSAVTGASPAGVERVVALAAAVGGHHQAGVDEHAQVLADRGSRDRAAGGQVDHAGRRGRHLLEQRPAYRVGQRGEDIHRVKGNR